MDAPPLLVTLLHFTTALKVWHESFKRSNTNLLMGDPKSKKQNLFVLAHLRLYLLSSAVLPARRYCVDLSFSKSRYKCITHSSSCDALFLDCSQRGGRRVSTVAKLFFSFWIKITISFHCHWAYKKYFARESLAKITYKRKLYNDGI